MGHKLILVAIAILFLMSFVLADYTAPSAGSINITLTTGYIAPNYSSLNITLGTTATTACNPTINSDWIITDAQLCNGIQVTTGTGAIKITGGNLTLINGANVTAKGVNISVTGDRIFILKGSELRT